MKFIYLLCIFIPILLNANIYKNIQEIQEDFDSIVIKDLNSNKLVFSKDKNQELSPASLTKIMTTILALEYGKPKDVITITSEMKKVEPTILNFKVGEKFYLEDLIYATMIKSANDASLAIAYHIGKGNKDKFINLMNIKAKKLGMRNTIFTNPSGFDIKNNISSTGDMLLLTEYAIKNKMFNKIVNTKSHTITTLNTKKQYKVFTTNKLLKDDPYVIGVKTGYTKKAGACLVARAKKDNQDYLIVMLNSKNRWSNTQKIVNTVLNKNLNNSNLALNYEENYENE